MALEKVTAWTIKGMGLTLFLVTIATWILDQKYSTLDVYHFNLLWWQIGGLLAFSFAIVLFPVSRLRIFGSKYIDKKLNE